MASPITGADGNVEFLLHVRAGTADVHLPAGFDPAALVASVATGGGA
jgi:hypothetical protein